MSQGSAASRRPTINAAQLGGLSIIGLMILQMSRDPLAAQGERA